MELQSLNPSHLEVMRLLATGRVNLKDICDAYKLNYAYWTQVVNTTLFKAGLERKQRELDAAALKSAIDDPVRLRLMSAGEKAANRLIAEVDNMTVGSSAGSRIKAAESILDRLGYSQRPEENKTQQTIVLNISASKLQVMQNIVSTSNLKPLEEAIKTSDRIAEGNEVQPGASLPAIPTLVVA